jgi:hypothetical protein
MKCWHCDSEAKAVCVFCGRAICAAHHKTKEHFVGYGKKTPVNILDTTKTTSAIHVSKACWCGVCEVEYVETN